MTQRNILAGDIGGSHFTLAQFEKTLLGPELIRIERVAVDSTGSKEEILEAWASMIKTMIRSEKAVSISLAMPAPFDYDAGICLIQEQGKFLQLFEINLKRELSLRLHIPESSIIFINDAQAFLLGEASFGKGKGYASLMGLTLGSGLGSSIKQGDDVRDAGLWQQPFKDGIAEDYLGTSWFVNYVKREFGIEIEGVKEMFVHPEISDRLDEIFDQYAQNLAVFISEQYDVFKMDKVILGGNITRAAGWFLDKTLNSLRSLGVLIPVEISDLGEKSAVYGAASVLFSKKKISNF